MKVINKYTDIKSIKIGDQITDKKGKSGFVKSINKESLAWGLKYTFTLINGNSITYID